MMQDLTPFGRISSNSWVRSFCTTELESRSLIISLIAFWVTQIIWVCVADFRAILKPTSFMSFQVWTVSLPLTILNSRVVSDKSIGGSNPPFGTSRDIAGIVLWAIGWSIETIADFQKVR